MRARRSTGRGSENSCPSRALKSYSACGWWNVRVLVARPEQEDEQGLRDAARDQQGSCLRGDDLTDGEVIGPLMRLFGQFLT
jgi:hypothetical protein